MPEFTDAMATDRDWYWVSADGKRMLSGKRCAVVGADDAAYLAWLAARPVAAVVPKGTLDADGQPESVEVRRGATPWPRDEAGADSDAELDAVLLRYGLSLAGPVRLAEGGTLARSLRKAPGVDMAKVRPDDLAYIAGRARVPETAQSVARIAAAAGTSAKAWFDAALNQGA